ncbi:peptide transport protein PTR2 [Xylona heveae TC161]|uniref:Peptide transport protein PTR2 n=1 Tax=Xylona heveae (strain CBS 132557 / TC161) TaxID=1328760 RepID=A0A165A6Y9_XYLHT|nr:peptide transport protein PTR2 [Xylona heveae TC161]KZF20042.1 peptide transport protein PTR2 [Xylona heveae TC161]
MTERVSDMAKMHATEVQPRKGSMQDMAGGTEVGPINTAPAYAEPSMEGSIGSMPLDGEEPTEEEKATLRHVADKLPKAAFLVSFVELCERFAYYGLSGPFQNYIQNKVHDPSGVPGVLGMGQTAATGLTNYFQFWCYLTPIIGAIVADQYLGRYNAILLFSVIYTIGLLILVTTAIPSAIAAGASKAGLIVAMTVIGLGTGGIKSNVSPLIADQYKASKQYVKTLKSGERVIVDPGVTIQRIYMIFYLCINVGSLSAIATTEMEHHIGFWWAYLLPMIMFIIGFVFIAVSKPFYTIRPPTGSVIPHAFKVMWIGLTHKGDLNAAKPTYREEYGGSYSTPWNDSFVDEMRVALQACKVFVFYPVYWVVYTQMLNNFISQAGTMELHGIPNDLMQNIDPITIIIFIPICDRLVYPLLRKVGIKFKPITRITAGFMFGALSMAYAAIVQHLIYSAGPCYKAPLACDASQGGVIPNHIHVAVQTPAYLFIGLSEIFASITGLEYAYTKAPPTMKSFIMAMFLLTSAFGSALAIALSPTAVDPKLLWMYIGLAIACFIAGILFWFIYSPLNATEDEMNETGAGALEEKEDPALTYSIEDKA